MKTISTTASRHLYATPTCILSNIIYCLYTLFSIYAHVHRRAKHLVLCGNFVIFDISKATKQKYTICASTCMHRYVIILYMILEGGVHLLLLFALLLTNTFDSTKHHSTISDYVLYSKNVLCTVTCKMCISYGERVENADQNITIPSTIRHFVSLRFFF